MYRGIIAFAIVSIVGVGDARAYFYGSYECVARKWDVRYTVKLDGAYDHRSMTVIDSRGKVTSGRAIAYRHGTRFYLPDEFGAGFKLEPRDDSQPGSLCLEDGGRDCHPCEPLLSRRQRYLMKRVCTTSTPNGPYNATLYVTGEPTDELVIEDVTGEIASGPVQSISHVQTTMQLQIGPSEKYTFLPDAEFLCTTDETECYPCEQSTFEFNETAPRFPRMVLTTCSTSSVEVTLSEQGADFFMSIESLEPDLGLGSSSGPVVDLGGDRWGQGGFRELTLWSGYAQLCTLGQGCEPCFYDWAD